MIRGGGNPYASIMGRYLMSRLPLQVLYALKIPYDLLGVARKIARPKLLGNEEISTIIRAGLEPVFQVRPPLPTAQAMLKRRQFSNLDPYWNTSGQRYP